MAVLTPDSTRRCQTLFYKLVIAGLGKMERKSVKTINLISGFCCWCKMYFLSLRKSSGLMFAFPLDLLFLVVSSTQSVFRPV